MRLGPTLTHRSPRPRHGLAVWCALALALPPATTPAAEVALPVALYPLSADGLTRDELVDVESVLISGLHQAARGGTLVVRDPPLLRPSCGRNPSDECLAGLAGQGVVLVARARRDGLNVAVAVALVKGNRKRTRWGSFLTTLSVQDARPCAQALWMLENELSSPGSLPPPLLLPPPPVAVRAPPPAPAAPPPPDLRPSSAPAPQAVAPIRPAPAAPPPAAPASGWSTSRVAAAWTAGAGLAVVLAGGVAGLQARKLDGQLTDRFNAGTLTPADAPTYDSVRRWNRTANGLFLAGGLLTAAGTTWFLLTPSVEPVAGGGLAVGLAGRF